MVCVSNCARSNLLASCPRPFSGQRRRALLTISARPGGRIDFAQMTNSFRQNSQGSFLPPSTEEKESPFFAVMPFWGSISRHIPFRGFVVYLSSQHWPLSSGRNETTTALPLPLAAAAAARSRACASRRPSASQECNQQEVAEILNFQFGPSSSFSLLALLRPSTEAQTAAWETSEGGGEWLE